MSSIFIHEDHWGMRNLYPAATFDEAVAEMDEAFAAGKRNRDPSGAPVWSDMHFIRGPSTDFTHVGLTLRSACAALEPIMPRVSVFNAALPQAPNDPYGSHQKDAYCYGYDENCFVKLEPRGDLVAGIWFETPIGDRPNLAVLRSALLAIDALAPCVLADYWVNAVGEVADQDFLDAYFDHLSSQGAAKDGA